MIIALDGPLLRSWTGLDAGSRFTHARGRFPFNRNLNLSRRRIDHRGTDDRIAGQRVVSILFVDSLSTLPDIPPARILCRFISRYRSEYPQMGLSVYGVHPWLSFLSSVLPTCRVGLRILDIKHAASGVVYTLISKPCEKRIFHVSSQWKGWIERKRL